MKINNYIDHTILKRDAVSEEIMKVVDEAIKYEFKSVCVMPTWITLIKEKLHENNILVCAVFGFPFGQTTTETKVFEAKDAIEKGVDELDFVANISKIHERDTKYLVTELNMIRSATKGKTIKLIIETGLLNDDEKRYITELGATAGWDFIKTSTGIGTTGATVEDVLLMKEVINGRAKIKASGGIKTREQAEKYISIGADRLGSSNGVDLMEGNEVKGGY